MCKISKRHGRPLPMHSITISRHIVISYGCTNEIVFRIVLDIQCQNCARKFLRNCPEVIHNYEIVCEIFRKIVPKLFTKWPSKLTPKLSIKLSTKWSSKLTQKLSIILSTKWPSNLTRNCPPNCQPH